MLTPLPEAFLLLSETSSLDMKRQMLQFLLDDIAKCESLTPPPIPDPFSTDISSFVEHVDDLVLDEELICSVKDELGALKLTFPPQKVNTQWISPSSESYNYGKVINNPKPIAEFPNISKLMDLVNSHHSTTGDMDACLVSCFPSPQAKLRIHKDDEPLISQTSSICTLSLGAPRTLEFIKDGNKKKSKKKLINDLSADIELPATDRSMNVMKPGAQSVMRHRVKAGVSIPGNSDVRYSLSFRKIVPKTPKTKVTDIITPTLPNISPDIPQIPLQNPIEEHIPPKKNIILVAGDSFPARLDAKRLGKGKKDVRIIARGGSKITTVQKSIENFVDSNPNLVVKKLFVSIGTNDIRYCENGIKHLKNAICDLMRRIRELFPDTKVWFQGIPPIHPNGCRYTVRNVCDMNILIYNNLCSRFKVFYMDVFRDFLDKDGFIKSKLFPEYDAIKGFDIHPNTKGYGVLASHYIYLIHTKWFNPLGY